MPVSLVSKNRTDIYLIDKVSALIKCVEVLSKLERQGIN
jgi:hypothetical protein